MAAVDSRTPFAWPVRIYYEDTDAQGVVYYANYFRFMERARTEWLRALGVDQLALLDDARRMFVVTATRTEFLMPARFNDEIIVTAELADLSRATFGISQNIYLGSLDGPLILRGSVTAAYIHADTLRPQRVPAAIFKEN